MTEQHLKGDCAVLYVLVSNNRLMGTLALEGTIVHHLDSSSLAVLEHARDLIHRGYKLLNHPLYGNFRPYQQPYRTIILQDVHGHAQGMVPAQLQTASKHSSAYVDLTSLQLMEEALLIFQNNKVLTPHDAPKSMLLDCAMIDLELLRFSLESIGWKENAVPEALAL